jgi:hypothetical protein
MRDFALSRITSSGNWPHVDDSESWRHIKLVSKRDRKEGSAP